MLRRDDNLMLVELHQRVRACFNLADVNRTSIGRHSRRIIRVLYSILILYDRLLQHLCHYKPKLL